MKNHISLYIIAAILLLTACNGSGMRTELQNIDEIIETSPDAALTLLNKYGKNKDTWSKADRMRYELIRTKALYKTGVTVRSDSSISEIVSYFDHRGNSNERVLAHYLLGRTYSMMGEAPQALQAYYDAIDEADTLNLDFNYNTLAAVYGQMANIFHQQYLPHDEIWALNHYVGCIKHLGDSIESVVAQSQLIRPYYILGEKDSVLQMIDNSCEKLRLLGEYKRAAGLLPSAIYIYTERGQLDEAHRLITDFENNSGLFDEDGSITKGREHYYCTKGIYELATNKLDSAEWYFRKAIQHGYLSDGYKGLLAVYRHKNVLDSIILFSKLYENAQDTLHNQMQIDATHRMSALYDYSRTQKELEEENHKTRTARIWIGIILFLVGLSIILATYKYKKIQQKKREQISKLDKALMKAKDEYTTIQNELQRLRNQDYISLIAEKEQKGQELRQTIVSLAGGNQPSISVDDLEKYENSKIVSVFNKKKDFKSDNPIPNKAEWRALEMQFSKDMPTIYKILAKEKKLSPLELHTCILLFLDFEDGAIANLSNAIPQTITTAKSRANKKIFNEKGAQTLKVGLLHLIKEGDLV